jgi:hypothetical protein
VALACRRSYSCGNGRQRRDEGNRDEAATTHPRSHLPEAMADVGLGVVCQPTSVMCSRFTGAGNQPLRVAINQRRVAGVEWRFVESYRRGLSV